MKRCFCRLSSSLTNGIHEGTERGATMVEYAIVAATIAAVAAASVKLVGIAVQGLFTTLFGKL